MFILTVSLQVAVQLGKNRFIPIFQKSEAAGTQEEARLRPEQSNPTVSDLGTRSSMCKPTDTG